MVHWVPDEGCDALGRRQPNVRIVAEQRRIVDSGAEGRSGRGQQHHQALGVVLEPAQQRRQLGQHLNHQRGGQYIDTDEMELQLQRIALFFLIMKPDIK